MDESYAGPHQQTFQKLRWEVPVLMRQTMIDVSVRTGLRFEEGWSYPLLIRFVDGSPMGVENVLAYVQLTTDGRKIYQEMNINLTAYESQRFNFDKVLAHELVHAMLNDALGAQASLVLPLWFHEGLAVYGANQGDQVVKVYAAQYPNTAEQNLIDGLEDPHEPLDYAEDYLAFKYIHEVHGVNGLHNFIREVVARKGDIPGALEYTCFEKWDKFQENAARFARDRVFQTNRHNRGEAEKPY